MSEIATGGPSEGVEDFFSGVKFDDSQSTAAETKPTQTAASAPAESAVAPAVPAAAPAPAATPPVEQSFSISPDQLAKILESARGTAAEPTVKEPTPAEIDAKMGVVRPTEEDISAVFQGGPNGAKKMEELLHGAARMGATIAAHHAVEQLNKLKDWVSGQLGGLAPAKEIAEQQVMKQHSDTFFKQYTHFTSDHVPILKSVYDTLLARGFKGTPSEVYAKINEEATKLIRVISPGFALAQATGTPNGTAVTGSPQQGTRQAMPPSQMTPLPMGGTGGSGAGSGNSTGKKEGPRALFDD